jgi:cell division protein FtsB
MEVHHHPHVHGKKKFTEYLLESFMLFLAVTLGFLAENLREHLTEQRKEKEYITSFVDDLKKDTAEIRSTSKQLFRNIHEEDSLIYLLQHYTNTDSANKKCYRHYLLSSVNVAFASFNQNTMNQLLNTGSVRLIGKQFILDSIMAYNALIKSANLQAEYYNDQFKKGFDYSANIFDLSYIHARLNDDYSMKPTMRYDTAHFKLIDTEETVLHKYAAYLIMQQSLSTNYLLQLRGTKEYAERLIQLLKKQYRLKEEH